LEESFDWPNQKESFEFDTLYQLANEAGRPNSMTLTSMQYLFDLLKQRHVDTVLIWEEPQLLIVEELLNILIAIELEYFIALSLTDEIKTFLRTEVSLGDQTSNSIRSFSSQNCVFVFNNRISHLFSQFGESYSAHH
jgi:hypothetical protein